MLKERDFPYSDIKMLASSRSAGKEVQFDGATYTIEELTEDSFGDCDIALFSAGGGISKKYAPLAVEANCTVVDNSSAFRMTEGVPLVIPEVNADAMAGMKVCALCCARRACSTRPVQLQGGRTAGPTLRWPLLHVRRERVCAQAGKGGIVANPNCSTIIALMAVTPLHRAKTVKRMVVSTYQAASGAGQAAMDELEAQTKAVIDGTDVPMEIFPFQYAFNLFSHNAPMQENGYNEEVRLGARSGVFMCV